jgi:hypothetical protein
VGIQVFSSIAEAIRAGCTIDSSCPDSEGFLHARIQTPAGWAQVLIRTSRVRS